MLCFLVCINYSYLFFVVYLESRWDQLLLITLNLGGTHTGILLCHCMNLGMNKIHYFEELSISNLLYSFQASLCTRQVFNLKRAKKLLA